MTRIKLCGLSRPAEIETVNRLKPEYIGFVFAPKSRRYVTPEQAAGLKVSLSPDIQAVGVFVNEPPENVARLLRNGVIDLAQLHGAEDDAYLRQLRALTDRPVIQAFRVASAADVEHAQRSPADYILLDSGSGGSGTLLDWGLLRNVTRPYFLAGGLTPQNAARAIRLLHPYALDVSSGIESNARKDPVKMAAFVRACGRTFRD